MNERRRKRLPRSSRRDAEGARRTYWHEAIEKFLTGAHISRSNDAGSVVEGMLLVAADEHDNVVECSITGDLPNLIVRGAARQGIELQSDIEGTVRSALTALRKASETEVEVEFHGDSNAVMLEVVTPGPRGRRRGTYTLRMQLSRESFADPSVATGRRVREALYDAIEDIDFFSDVLPLDALGDLGAEIFQQMIGNHPPKTSNVRPFLRGIAITLADFLADRLAHLGTRDALALIECVFAVRLDVEKLRTADFYPSVLRSFPLPAAADRLLALVVVRLPVLNVIEKLYAIQLLRAFSGRQEIAPAAVQSFFKELQAIARVDAEPFFGSLLRTSTSTSLGDLLARAVDDQKARKNFRTKLEEVRQHPRAMK